ncbi:8-amino-7-oxononanoate synthase, partial [bacterium]|nr:8-amino-7-oxononanoate synthase [bacterium]
MRNYLIEKLNLIKIEGRYREFVDIDSPQDRFVNIDGKKYLNFSSNNYLGLANDSRIKEALIKGINKYGAGSGASRFISGNLLPYKELEEKISALKKCEDAIVFGSGYTANIGIISCLADKDTAVFVDRLNHASIIDGVRMSGAKMVIYNHVDIEDLHCKLDRYKKVKNIIITDAVFSMDGDLAPLKEIYNIAVKNNCLLIVDEAHGLGVFGKKGLGLTEHYGLCGKDNLIVMGTLSKSAGLLGGYVTGQKDIIDYIRNTARPLIYSTALPPSIVFAALKAFDIITQDFKLREKLWDNIKYFKAKSQIIPVVIGDNDKTLEISSKLREAGILLPAIRFPTVKKGSERLRVSLSALHEKKDIDVLVKFLQVNDLR